jgi:hypothetical protein
MKKLLGAVALSVGLMSAFSANAATYNEGSIGTGSGFQGTFNVGSGSFTDYINFSVNTSGLTGNASPLNLAIGPYKIWEIQGLTFQLFKGTSTNPGAALSSQWVGGGNYFAKITGTADGLSGGFYGAAINVSPVPEPATYGMFLGGLGVVAFLARRRKAKSADMNVNAFAAA